MSAPTQRPRIVAIDALRGLDMFLLCGGISLVCALLIYLFPSSKEWVTEQSRHAGWDEALTAWDLVMPLFIFVVGAAMPFSLGERALSSKRWRVYLKVALRVALLFTLGMIAQGNLLSFKPERMALFCNTLQAIAGGYLIAAMLMLHFKRVGQILATIILLLGYWLAIQYMPFTLPNGEQLCGTIEPYRNLPYAIDKYLQGDMQDGTPYTWILSNLAFGALTMLGVFAGSILKEGVTPWRNCLWLALMGTALLALGELWGLILPLNKYLFTSSMVLWAAGWCMLLLAVIYLITDVLGWRKIAFPLVVVGSNALFVYLWTTLCNPINSITPVLFGGFSNLFEEIRPIIWHGCNCLLIWLVLFFLYRKRAFFRV